MTSFKDLNLSQETQAVLERLGFTQPTDIQAKAIPLLLSRPMDFHGQAQTGTGKTLAFGLPLIDKRINKEDRSTQALVVAPTRELAIQICDSLKPFAQEAKISITTIYGGSPMEEQIRTLKRGVQIVIGTPGRLNDHLRRKTLNIGSIKTLVLDEADIMLDMGFKDEVEEILKHAPENREIWLFSATVKSGISDLMSEYMHDTQSVKVAKKADIVSIEQFYCVVPMRQRLAALQRFIESATDFYGFVFCQTKILTSEIAEELIRAGYKVGALHGDLSQAQRNLVIKRFKSKEITVVVATDVAARGIDIANLTYVINYSLPEDLESYVHRVGRTGRAGKTGTAIAFINRSETRAISLIQKKFNFTINPINVPSKEQIITSRLKFAQEYLAQVSESHIQHHDALKSLVAQLSAEELRDIIEKMVYDKFIKSIDQEENIAFASTPKEEGFEGSRNASGLQEFCLAVGADDGVNQQDITDYLTDTKLITADQIAKIRVIKRKTFVEVPQELAAPLMNALAHTSLAGRKTRIALVEPQEEGRGGFGGGRGRHHGRGGFRSDRGGEGRGGFGGSRGGDRGGYRGRR